MAHKTQVCLKYLTSLPLNHNGDCALLGITPDEIIYAEEVYGDDGWMAQHALKLDGARIATIDERAGENQVLSPLLLPADLIAPQPPRIAVKLNFTGPRWRGLRSADRIDDMVYPLDIAAKFDLVRRLTLPIPAPLLIGVAESRVLAEAQLEADCWLVCRRLRLAYALPQPHIDSDGVAYDYDTLPLYLAHLFFPQSDQENLLPVTAFDGLPDIELVRPMDCLTWHNLLLVAEGGTPERPSAIHSWRLRAADSDETV